MKTAAAHRGHALVVLALCFFASGLMRTGDVVAALPDRVAPGAASGDTAGQAVSGAAQGVTPGAEPPDAEHAIDVPSLAAELHRRQAALAAREVALDERARLLEVVESRLRVRLAELEAAQKKLEETAELVDDAAGKDVRHLVAMYEQMKPKRAGQIFNAMDPTFAAGFLGQMNAPAAALILANMEAEKAYSVSLLLAGRNVARD